MTITPAKLANALRTGNFKDGVAVSPVHFADGPMVLTPDDVGKHFYMSTSVPVGANVSLPESGLCPTGSIISFHSTNTNTFRINAAGTDTIGMKGGNPLTTMLVYANSYLAFVNVGLGRWELYSQSGIGEGQSWKINTGTWATNTDYLNTTGRAIMVVARSALNGNNTATYIYVDGIHISEQGQGTGFAMAVVPPGSTFRFGPPSANQISLSVILS